MMKVTDFYKYAAWGLLALNLLLISIFWWNKPSPPPHIQGPRHHMEPPSFKNRIIEELNFDDGQKDLFLKSVSNHVETMEALVQQKDEHLKRYFGQLNAVAKPKQDGLEVANIEDVERKMLEATYQHLTDIKSILKPNQEAQFEVFMDEILKNIMPGGNGVGFRKRKK